MNKPVDQSTFQTPTVTSGALPSSSKVYTAPDADPTLRVPHRLVHLHESANEPDVPVYDTSGPYSDASVTIDVKRALPVRVRRGLRRAAGSRSMKAVTSSPKIMAALRVNSLRVNFLSKTRRCAAWATPLSLNMNLPRQASSPKK